MNPTLAIGIHQSDLVIRSAIEAALDDMRRNPWLLNYVFANVSQDTLTANTYGDKEVAKAKQWFLSNKISVFLNTRIDQAKLPAISIALMASNETEKTLGDINYDPSEDNTDSWPDLSVKFDPVSYNSKTGLLILPANLATAPSLGVNLGSLWVTAGQVIVTSNGHQYPILSVNDQTTLTIATGIIDNLDGSVIRGNRPSQVTMLESVQFAETYSLGCHAHGEPVYAIYLHSIVVFVLLLYKQTLLEARGFERSVLQSTDLLKNDMITDAENAYSRWINISGYVRQVWPKNILSKITGVVSQPKIIGGGVMLPNETQTVVDAAPFVGDGDKTFF